MISSRIFFLCFFPTQEYFSASRALHYYPQLGVTYAKRENKKISGGQIKAQESYNFFIAKELDPLFATSD